MDPIYAETINAIGNDIDSLYRDKDAFSSVKSNGNMSIEDGNLCSYKRFMLSSKRGSGDNANSFVPKTDKCKRAWGSEAHSMPLIDRLAKTASIWTLPDISRMQTDKILHEFQPGVFLVRMTTDKKTMVLSYRMKKIAQHVLIKVDLKRGFYMDGSIHVFRNVNEMIAHYMKHPIRNPDLCLKLPRALMEAYDAVHFQFFENMKINFWTTLLAMKGIDDIWSKTVSETKPKENSNEYKESGPALPPRGYLASELNILQGLAEASDEVNAYQEIRKKNVCKYKPLPAIPDLSLDQRPTSRTTINSDEDSGMTNANYGAVWQFKSNSDALSVDKKEVKELPQLTKDLDDSITNRVESTQLVNNHRSEPKVEMEESSLLIKYQDYCSKNGSENVKSVNTYDDFEQILISNRSENSIPKIIESYYPQIIYKTSRLMDSITTYESLTEAIRQFKTSSFLSTLIKGTDATNNAKSATIGYEIPWDQKNVFLAEIMSDKSFRLDGSFDDCRSVDNLIPKGSKNSELNLSCSYLEDHASKNKPNLNDGNLLRKNLAGDRDSDQHENTLQGEFLGAIETVMYSISSSNQMYTPKKSQFGRGIRNVLRCLCSLYGASEISNSIRLFISCTVEREDLSPYTSMRLIRQYMSGMKNFIVKNQERFSLNVVIKKEMENTPKNVFINLDSIIESELTRSVLKPLGFHIYRLLVLEHYKNNNLKLISDGVEISNSISPEKLGLKENAKAIIDSKLEVIRQKFIDISNHYSPEKKIKFMVSIVDIVFNMIKLIYPDNEREGQQIEIKSNHILPLFVYIFSQCKLDAVATQCEVEYVEGLIWSSRLVNGEPGFFLLNLMSALEAIKVLARPKLNPSDIIDLSDKTSTNSSSFSSAMVGSVNVIMIEEKINRLVTKVVPVRSTVTVGSLCKTIAHRLGIFNPTDYHLYMYNGNEEFPLRDHESPLLLKMAYQQKNGENIHFLFKRKNINFILPKDASLNR